VFRDDFSAAHLRKFHLVPFTTFDDAIVEANRLPYGLAAYAYTSSTKTALPSVRRSKAG